MPIHVYHCDACGERFERLQKLSDPDPRSCPHCGKRGTIEREVSAPAFRLAGKGWYETDFKSDKETRHNLAGHRESGSPPKGDKTSDSAKPAGADKPGTTGKRTSRREATTGDQGPSAA